ncbi:MAG TPA: patatin-like phospholipase family protein [Syntrophomonadaceae bacterium]|nr:patatin-like phospholipase family protein [Syntrophomonadaceae bacterium]HPU49405.1 patatin-like phospholipase family protein [Syntrophomonadaceae bacterium]
MKTLIGLVLEGGGARGAYQIGAYRAIQEMGIEIKGIAGTSVGALNGAMIAQGDTELAYQLWWDITPDRVFKLDSAEMQHITRLGLSRESLPRLIQRLRVIFRERGLDVTPLKELIAQMVKEEVIRQAGLDFGLVTISLPDMRPLELFLEDIPEGMLADYLMASASLPGFKVDPVEGRRMLDGGLHDNLPVKLLVDKGYREIIVLRTHGPGRYRRVRQKDLHLTYISPSDHLGGILQFSPERARTNLKMGYYDALKTMHQLKGFRFYIHPWNKDYFLDCFLALDAELVRDLGRLMGFRGGSHRRMLFEQILPRYCQLLEITRQSDYEEIGLRLLEEIAERCGVERFRIYHLDEFLDIIGANYQNFYQMGNRPDPDKNRPGWPRGARQRIMDQTAGHWYRGLVESRKSPSPV